MGKWGTMKISFGKRSTPSTVSDYTTLKTALVAVQSATPTARASGELGATGGKQRTAFHAILAGEAPRQTPAMATSNSLQTVVRKRDGER